jgi:DNA-binding CsgD family transcriptional regulator
LFISVTTVDTHRKNLLAKFDARNTASLIRTAARLQMI